MIDDGEEDDYDATKRRRRRRRQQKRHRIIWLLYLVLITTSLFFLYSYTRIITDSKRSNNIIIRTNIIFANNTTTGNTTNNIVSSQQQQQSEPKPEPKLAVDQSQSQNQQHNGLLLPPPPLPLPLVMVMVPSPSPVAPVPVPPLVIGAGAGSTGTHTMYCGTYLLGLPSVHWKLETDYCKSESNINTIINTDNNNNNITFFGGQQQLQQWQEGRSSKQQSNNNAHHKQLVNKVFRMHKCLDKRNKEPCPHNSDRTNNMIEWMEETKTLIDKVTSWHKHNNNHNIGAIHDTPYIEFLPYVIESATKNRNGQIPIILLSERNPIEWSERRTEKHPVILCRIDLLNHDSNDSDDDNDDDDDDVNDNDNSSVTTSNSTIATTSHFDWFSCIERTVHAKKEKLLLQQQQQGVNIVMNNIDNITVNVKLSEVFTTYINLCIGFGNPVEVIDDGIGMMSNTKRTKNKEWFPDELKSHISFSFDAYQNNILKNLHVDYHVNMFDRRNNTNEARISHKTVALEVQRILLLREQQTR